MLERQFTHCLLRPSDIKPISEHTEVVGTFNPAAAEVDGQVLLLIRVVEAPTEHREGFVASPGFGPGGQIGIDWLDAGQMDLSDPRKYVSKQTGRTRLRFFSYFMIVRSSDGTTLDASAHQNTTIMPQGIYEEYGIEDPRITRIGETWYITYVGVSRHGVSTCLMSTTDFTSFTRHGVIFYPENKDVLLFPEKIAGDYLAIHRPVPSMQFHAPEMWLARSPDLIHWGAYEQLLGPETAWQNSRIGGGTPPIRTREGWLSFYHGSARQPGRTVGAYTAGLLLMDLSNPARIIACTDQPVMKSEHDFETGGYVANVVFPTALLERDDMFYVYYGAADANTGVVGFQRGEVMDALTREPS